MRISPLIALGVFALATTAGADDSKKYSMADLKALVDQKHFLEALQHATDIAPSERKVEWNDMVGMAATGFALNGKDAIEKLRNMLTVEEMFPTVVKHAKYAAVRTEWGPKGFDVCFQNSYDPSDCRSYAIKFIDDDASNGKLALAMAKVARRGMNAYNSAPLFKRAVTATKATACKDEDLKLMAVAALGLPTDYDDYKDGKSVADTCWADLKPAVLKELASEGSGYFHDNACATLKAKKDSASVAKYCAAKKDD